MDAFMKEIQHLKIELEEIKSATGNFDNKNLIGRGGFGMVYQGVVSNFKGQTKVAFKRLDRRHGQGDPQLFKEILFLSNYTHENLISLLGFCDQDGEKILVYELASHGSLDRLLGSTTLTWRQRLKICLGAAKGICYLHDPKGTQQRVLHRDIKSSNILLDRNWNAKVSDMGLSKIGPANQHHTFLATEVAGTPGYVDPLYMETYSLTKESDVYSFGLVLFEVLCGRLCVEYNSGNFKSLWPMWKTRYEEMKLDGIIFKDLKQHMSPRSLNIFSDIAYRCCRRSREDRPKMSQVVEELESALQFQEMEQPVDYGETSNTTVVPGLFYEFEEALKMLLYKGFMVNDGKTWLWLSKNGKHCEMISAAKCLIPTASPMYGYDGGKKSRFQVDCHKEFFRDFKTQVRTEFLSPGITYAVNLVFDIDYVKMNYLLLNYKLAGERQSSDSDVLDKREDGWFTTELYQFTSDGRSIDLEITFHCINPIAVEAIEFQPVERHEVLLEDEEVHMQTDAYWIQKLPSDYRDIIKQSKDGVQWTSKKELYSILCKGFLIKNGEEWFSLGKKGKKCHMLPASVVLLKRQWKWWSSPESRFEEVASSSNGSFWITCNSKVLLPQTTYACYLVYKIQNERPTFPYRVQVTDRLGSQNSEKFHIKFIQLKLSETPIIRRKVNDNTPNPLKRTKMKGVPQRRNDGWMEVQLWESHTGNATGETTLFELGTHAGPARSFRGLIVQGIEFKVI